MKSLKWLFLGCGLALVLSHFASAIDKPYEGISADDLMKIKYYIKHTKFAQDYQSAGDVWLITKGGFKRHRKFLRSRITLNRESDGVDYKDMVVFTEPGNVKGLAILTWTYINPKKEQDSWLWLPSLRKIRRISQSQADDSFMGTDFTTEEITLRRWEDETYEIIGNEKFKGYHSEFTGKTYYEGLDCYVVEAKPKRKDWYYSKRIVWIDKNTGASIFDEIYDPLERKARTLFREYQEYEKGYLPQTLLECKDMRTGHKTIITFDEIKFDSGLKEGLFTEKTLLRGKW
jgi:hypothetical protein